MTSAQVLKTVTDLPARHSLVIVRPLGKNSAWQNWTRKQPKAAKTLVDDIGAEAAWQGGLNLHRPGVRVWMAGLYAVAMYY